MHARATFGVLAILIASTVQAQIAAVIDGPRTADIGDLIILSAERANGQAFRWILATRPRKSFLPVDGGRKCVFASGTPGDYTFVLVVAGEDPNGDLDVQLAEHTVRVGEKPDPDPDPDPVPPDPDPVPEGEFGIAPKVYTWAISVGGDTAADEAKSLADSFQATSSAAAAGTITAIEEFLKSSTESNREALGSRRLSWRGVFFVPLDQYLRQLRGDGKLSDLESHARCWSEIAIGLQAAAETPRINWGL